MSDEHKQLKLKCLELSGGHVERAQQMFNWLQPQKHEEWPLACWGAMEPKDIPPGATFRVGTNDDLYVVWQDMVFKFTPSAPTPPQKEDGSLLDPVQQETAPVQSAQEQDKAQPEIPEGFTKWESGYCPFDIGTHVEVLTRKNGVWPVVIKPEAPLLWEHEGHDLDIIAYRIIEAPTDGERISVVTDDDRVEQTPVENATEEGDGHASDCATHNEPAFPNGPCDCGAEPSSDASRITAPEPVETDARTEQQSNDPLTREEQGIYAPGSSMFTPKEKEAPQKPERTFSGFFGLGGGKKVEA